MAQLQGTPLQDKNIHPPFTFDIGDTWEILYTCHDMNDNKLDLTGASAEWRLDASDKITRIKTLDTPSAGLAILDPVAGTIFLTVPAAQTATILPGVYMDQLRITLADGTVTTQSRGRITARQNL